MLERLPTKLDGVVLLEPTVHGDERGFMVETYRRDLWAEHGVEVEFVQHNHSRSSKGTLRGLHFQTEPGQAKLVRCPRGKIFDVAVDLRRGSPTYGQWEGHVLDDEAHRQLFVPVGFGHGFAVLSEVADVTYLCSSTYDPATESGIAWDDPGVGVEWPVDDPLLSERDKTAPTPRRSRRDAAFLTARLAAQRLSGRRWPCRHGSRRARPTRCRMAEQARLDRIVPPVRRRQDLVRRQRVARLLQATGQRKQRDASRRRLSMSATWPRRCPTFHDRSRSASHVAASDDGQPTQCAPADVRRRE